jgi:hypothetical protein
MTLHAVQPTKNEPIRLAQFDSERVRSHEDLLIVSSLRPRKPRQIIP